MDYKTDLMRRSEALSLDKLLNQAGGGMFSLVRMAMIRAVEIQAGSPPLVDCRHLALDKYATIALEEISQGRMTIVSKGLKK